MSTATAAWSVWSCEARLVVTDPAVLDHARAVCDGVLAAVGAAASRFDPTSELSSFPDDGRPHGVSPLLADLVAEALTAAAATGGAVDPTIGATLIDLGYDRDITLLRADRSDDRPVAARIRRVPGWRTVRLVADVLTLPAGVVLDLGATAKASAADRCARAVAARFRTGVLVSLGGDIATAGPAPAGGWQVEVRDLPTDQPEQISLPAGWAVSTSSTRRRTWTQHGVPRTHLVDPRTSRPVDGSWAAVTVVARTCLAANAASTAAVVHGRSDTTWLRSTGLPALALDPDGGRHRFGGWHREEAA